MERSSREEIARALAPLLDVLASGSVLRLLAWPARVLVDRAGGSARVEVAWSPAQHAKACQALDVPTVLEDGVTATRVAGGIVLFRPPDPMRRVDDLVRDGRVSALAGRFLVASLALGRNVVIAAPWSAAVELITALLAEGQRPALVGSESDATPPGWPVVSQEQLIVMGADRIGAWSLPVTELVRLLASSSAVAAWIDAGRLDRALVRFEAAAERAFPGVTTPLQVLAGVDLVVVMSEVGGVRIREIAAVDLAEEGYRPRLLFATGVPPVPTALVPVGLPSFLDDLARAGHHVLVDELRHGVPGPPPAQMQTAPATVLPPQPVAAEPTAESMRMPPPEPTAPVMDPALAAAAPPGWELDQVDDEIGTDVTTTSPEAAALAASFGLGPPPPPPGVTPIGPELAAEAELGGEPAPVGNADSERAPAGDADSDGSPAPTFEDALGRARARQTELPVDVDDDDLAR